MDICKCLALQKKVHIEILYVSLKKFYYHYSHVTVIYGFE